MATSSPAPDREGDVPQRLDRAGRGRVGHPHPVEAMIEIGHAGGVSARTGGSSTLVRNSFV